MSQCLRCGSVGDTGSVGTVQLLINLDSRTDRLEQSLTEARRWGLSIERVGAIPASEAGESDEGRGLSAARRACWTSHQKCWALLAESNFDQALVLEDDVQFLRDINPIIRLFPTLRKTSQVECLQLGFLEGSDLGGRRGTRLVASMLDLTLSSGFVRHRALRTTLGSQALNQRMITRTLGQSGIPGSVQQTWRPGTHAYLIGRDFAERLLEFNSPPFLSADGAFLALASEKCHGIWSLDVSQARQRDTVSDIR